MSFVKFTESGRSFAPKASISTSGVINFNYGALKRFRSCFHEFTIKLLNPKMIKKFLSHNRKTTFFIQINCWYVIALGDHLTL
jgi:hypothetical protein